MTMVCWPTLKEGQTEYLRTLRFQKKHFFFTWDFSVWLFFSLLWIFSFSWSRSSFSLCSWATSDSCSPSSRAHSTSIWAQQPSENKPSEMYCWCKNETKLKTSIKNIPKTLRLRNFLENTGKKNKACSPSVWVCFSSGYSCFLPQSRDILDWGSWKLVGLGVNVCMVT